MKRLVFIISLIVLFASLISPSYAGEMVKNGDQNFVFYYQALVDVRGTAEFQGPSFTTPITNEEFTYTAPRTMSDDSVGNRIADAFAGDKTYTHTSLGVGSFIKVQSSHNPDVTYVVKRQIISTEEELFDAMGVTGMDDPSITKGQEAMVAAFRSAKSESLKERTEATYKPVLDIVLVDNSAYKGDKKYIDPDGNEQTVSDFDFRHDFWSNSCGNKIEMSTSNYSGKNAYNDAMSTFLHEYCHSIDKITHDKYKYGKDGTHYGDEMTSPKAAFVEGWAEYNEMIEYGYSYDSYAPALATVCVELSDDELAGYTFDPKLRWKAVEGGWFTNDVSTYTYKLATSLSAEELMKCESYNRMLLYQLATSTSGIENGKEKVFNAFMKVREKRTGTMADFIQQLCKDNPGDIGKIAEILDKLTYGKMSNDMLKQYLGYSNSKVKKEVDLYLSNRDTSNMSPSVVSSNTATVSGDTTLSSASAAAANYALDEPQPDKPAVPELTGTSDEEGSVFNIK